MGVAEQAAAAGTAEAPQESAQTVPLGRTSASRWAGVSTTFHFQDSLPAVRAFISSSAIWMSSHSIRASIVLREVIDMTVAILPKGGRGTRSAPPFALPLHHRFGRART